MLKTEQKTILEILNLLLSDSTSPFEEKKKCDRYRSGAVVLLRQPLRILYAVAYYSFTIRVVCTPVSVVTTA
jgi:hypothetical protein